VKLADLDPELAGRLVPVRDVVASRASISLGSGPGDISALVVEGVTRLYLVIRVPQPGPEVWVVECEANRPGLERGLQIASRIPRASTLEALHDPEQAVSRS
jgi:hypothetical protein